MTRWQRTVIIGLAGGVGGALAYAAGGGENDQGWFLGLFGFVGAMFLAGRVLVLISQVGDLSNRRRWLGPRIRTDPSPGLLLAPATPEATIARFAALDPLLAELAPEELAALPTMLDPKETVGGLTGVTRNGKPGLLAVTDQRLFFVPKGRPGHAELEIPLKQVTSIRAARSAVLGTLIVNAPGVEEGFEMGDDQLERFSLFLGVRVHPAPGSQGAS